MAKSNIVSVWNICIRFYFYYCPASEFRFAWFAMFSISFGEQARGAQWSQNDEQAIGNVSKGCHILFFLLRDSGWASKPNRADLLLCVCMLSACQIARRLRRVGRQWGKAVKCGRLGSLTNGRLFARIAIAPVQTSVAQNSTELLFCGQIAIEVFGGGWCFKTPHSHSHRHKHKPNNFYICWTWQYILPLFLAITISAPLSCDKLLLQTSPTRCCTQCTIHTFGRHCQVTTTANNNYYLKKSIKKIFAHD